MQLKCPQVQKHSNKTANVTQRQLCETLRIFFVRKKLFIQQSSTIFESTPEHNQRQSALFMLRIKRMHAIIVSLPSKKYSRCFA